MYLPCVPSADGVAYPGWKRDEAGEGMWNHNYHSSDVILTVSIDGVAYPGWKRDDAEEGIFEPIRPLISTPILITVYVLVQMVSRIPDGRLGNQLEATYSST